MRACTHAHGLIFFRIKSNRICFIYNSKYIRIIDEQEGTVIHDIEIPINDSKRAVIVMKLQDNLLYLRVEFDHYLVDIKNGQILQKDIYTSKTELNRFSIENKVVFMAGYSQLQAFSLK